MSELSLWFSEFFPVIKVENWKESLTAKWFLVKNCNVGTKTYVGFIYASFV